MIVFELSMPHKGSWNGKWSQEDKLHVIVKNEKYIEDKILLYKVLEKGSFFYRWSDGWEAEIDVKQMKSYEANKLRKKSDGFCGYDWMVESILKYGEIRKPER